MSQSLASTQHTRTLLENQLLTIKQKLAEEKERSANFEMSAQQAKVCKLQAGMGLVSLSHYTGSVDWQTKWSWEVQSVSSCLQGGQRKTSGYTQGYHSEPLSEMPVTRTVSDLICV